MSHRNSMYFLPLVSLPTVITEPGRYITRCGETVTVDTVSVRHNFGCAGQYPNGTHEGWHHSGRLLAGQETDNDVVRALT